MSERAAGGQSTSVFAFDLGRCTGCFTCVVACKDRGDLADGVNWMRVEPREIGRFPAVRVYFRPVHCYHCLQPACLDACAFDAIRLDGEWVQIDPDMCTGCGACTVACPFGAITTLPNGRATKCDGCADEVAQGAEPTCVRACPMRALAYGPVPVGGSLPMGRPRSADAGWDASLIAPRALYLVRTAVKEPGHE